MSEQVTSQCVLWNEIHGTYGDSRYARKESAFARAVVSDLAKGPHRSWQILELGCGAGADADYFFQQGYSVTAADFSSTIIQRNRERYGTSNVEFILHDTAAPLPFDDEHFDIVYSRLSLHYFTDRVTRNVFREIYRVLRPGGQLYFMCKSIADPLYEAGERIERDVYVLDGHLRHFFSKSYALDLLKECYFEPERIWARNQGVYGEPSAVVIVAARRPSGYIQLRLPI